MKWIAIIFSFFLSCACFAEVSLYDLQGDWRSTAGQAMPLKSLAGGPVLIAMVYTSCPHACPLTIGKIQEIQKAAEKSGETDLKIVLASFDLKKDTPGNLKKYQEKRNLDPKKWIFLSPKTENDVRELSVVLGVTYKDLGDGDFSHSNIITLLNEKGVPVARVTSLSESIDGILAALKEMHGKK